MQHQQHLIVVPAGAHSPPPCPASGARVRQGDRREGALTSWLLALLPRYRALPRHSEEAVRSGRVCEQVEFTETLIFLLLTASVFPILGDGKGYTNCTVQHPNSSITV